MRAVVVRRSTSSVIDQPTPSIDSDEWSAPAVKVGSGNDPSSSGSSSEPPCTVRTTGAGGAIVFGQSEPVTLTRSRLPGVQANAQASRSSSTSYSWPGTSGVGAPCTPSRKVRSTVPRETSAEVPSGKTSHSFTDSDASGWSTLTRSRARGWPTTGSAGRRDVPRQRAGVVEALVAGLAPRQVAGAVDPGGRPGVGEHGERAVARSARPTTAGSAAPTAA